LSIRISGDGVAGVLAMLRRAWNEENSGGPIDDPGFEATFFEWGDPCVTRTFFLVEIDDFAVGMANVKRYQRMPHGLEHRCLRNSRY
jgi:hypothetical protein